MKKLILLISVIASITFYSCESPQQKEMRQAARLELKEKIERYYPSISKTVRDSVKQEKSDFEMNVRKEFLLNDAESICDLLEIYELNDYEFNSKIVEKMKELRPNDFLGHLSIIEETRDDAKGEYESNDFLYNLDKYNNAVYLPLYLFYKESVEEANSIIHLLDKQAAANSEWVSSFLMNPEMIPPEVKRTFDDKMVELHMELYEEFYEKSNY